MTAQQIVNDIYSRYQEKTKRSHYHFKKAKNYLPGGETRESTAFKPYPTFMERGSGFLLFDSDGNEYIDFLGNYTSLVHGHCDPDITTAVEKQLKNGTMLGSVSEKLYEHAALLCNRVPSAELVRYTNSGTEATLWAVRAARAVTKKDMILKLEGAYHGTWDGAKVSVIPDLDARGIPVPHVEGLGIPASTLEDVIVAPFNDADAVEIQCKIHRDKLAAILVEPFLGSMGVIPPKPGFLKALRDIADRYEVLLIFDEIQAFRLSTGGIQHSADVTPDITALGKVIGGGFPVGAFAGPREIMDRFEFNILNPESINHSGTFNGNEISMVAGIAAINKLDKAAIQHINAIGEKLRKDVNAYFKTAGIGCQLLGIGSLSNIIYTDETIHNALYFVRAYIPCIEFQALFHLELINRGIYSAKRGEFVISTPMTETEIDTCAATIKETFEYFMPYIKEKIPHLL